MCAGIWPIAAPTGLVPVPPRRRGWGHGLDACVSRSERGYDTCVTRPRYGRGMTTSGAWFSLSEAASLSNKSRVTLRRYLDSGRFPSARQDDTDPNRPWLIPLGDLQDAGVVVTPTDQGGSTLSDPLKMVIVRLSVAEALAEERAAEIERLMRVVDALTAQTAVMAAMLEGTR